MNTEYVKLLNDTIKVDTGMDWVSILALIFTIVSTIGILLWQNYLRKQDIKLQQWNALYPHRLEFYTDFYKTLSNFKEYDTKKTPDKIIKDMEYFFWKFETYKNQAPVLFDNMIIVDTIGWYNQIIGRLKNEPRPDISDAFTFAELKDKGMKNKKYFNSFREQIEQAKMNIIQADKEDILKKHFNSALHFGGENE